MSRRFHIVSTPSLGLLLLAVLLGGVGCEGFQPLRLPVGDTVVLHSLARAEFIGELSGYDFATPRAVVVEEPGETNVANFDAAFSETAAGDPVMLPAGVFEGMGVSPGIAVDSSGVLFDELAEAPTDGYVTDEPVPLRTGVIYIVRTRSVNGCRRYAKFDVLDLDPDGLLEFVFLRNNLCNDRVLTDIEDD